jgi:hypothetical protein
LAPLSPSPDPKRSDIQIPQSSCSPGSCSPQLVVPAHGGRHTSVTVGHCDLDGFPGKKTHSFC